MTPPRDWQPAPEFLDALLAGLAASPILTTATIEDYFADVEPATSDGRPLVRRMAADTAERGVPTRRIKEARRRLDSFQTLLAATTDRQFVFEHLLFAAQAVDLARRRQLGYLDGLRDAIDAELALVEIPERQTIRLTARQGDIPIPILSRTGYPVRVLIRVDSDTLDFPRGEEHLVTLDHETTTERVPVRARSSGAFPLRVTVLSPDAQLAISASRLTVTSTAASWVGIALSAGAAMFLAVWWARHVHGRRSGKLMPP